MLANLTSRKVRWICGTRAQAPHRNGDHYLGVISKTVTTKVTSLKQHHHQKGWLRKLDTECGDERKGRCSFKNAAVCNKVKCMGKGQLKTEKKPKGFVTKKSQEMPRVQFRREKRKWLQSANGSESVWETYMRVHYLSRCDYKMKDIRGVIAWAELKGDCVSSSVYTCLRRIKLRSLKRRIPVQRETKIAGWHHLLRNKITKDVYI